jgi:putative NADPH-quinone reductase
MRRAILLFGHADDGTFNDRLARSYADGFRAEGGELERIDLAALRFDPILRHGYRVPQPLEPDLLDARARIEAADHLVWVFPTYWASPPAVVRGFVDRVFLPGWAFAFPPRRRAPRSPESGATSTRSARTGALSAPWPDSSLPKGLLAGRSARVITTMDTPSWWYTAIDHRCLHRSFGTATLSFCGLAPLRFTTVHGVRELAEPERARTLRDVARLGARDARARRSAAFVGRELGAP